MSLKHLKNAPCANCKADTLHFVCKCTVCGTVFETPTDLRQKTRRRMGLRGDAVNKRKGLSGAYRFFGTQGYAQARKIVNKSAREEYLAVPEETLKRGKKLENTV